ncbi:hypothetical protein DC31_13810 [Microbacterium sp. CH12i]|nr:hypothetical protein DC31_13810 [Microbacterium sp. CH12i]
MPPNLDICRAVELIEREVVQAFGPGDDTALVFLPALSRAFLADVDALGRALVVAAIEGALAIRVDDLVDLRVRAHA